MKMTIRRSIVRDESAQAMTEFVIVIPVVLLVFFTIFQLVMIWHAYLLTSYAAFAATRAAATYDAHIGTSAAQQMGKNAAALALMPVSRPVEGELEFYASRVGTSNYRNFLKQAGFKDHLLDKLPPIYNRVSGDSLSNADKLEWLFTAWNRLAYNPQARFRQSMGKQTLFEHKVPDNTEAIADKFGEMAGDAVEEAVEDKIGSGPLGVIRDHIGDKIGDHAGGEAQTKVSEKVKEKLEAASDLTEFNVELRYDYPLFIPGFAALWDSLSGPKIGDFYAQKSPSILHYFYTMKSRCAVGYETFYRDFENTGKQGTQGTELNEQLDEQRIAEVQQQIVTVTMALNTANQQLAKCDSQFKALGFNTAAACKATFGADILKLQQQLADLQAEMETLLVTR